MLRTMPWHTCSSQGLLGVDLGLQITGEDPALVLLSLRTRIVSDSRPRLYYSLGLALTQSVKPRQIPSIRDIPSLMRFMKVHNRP